MNVERRNELETNSGKKPLFVELLVEPNWSEMNLTTIEKNVYDITDVLKNRPKTEVIAFRYLFIFEVHIWFNICNEQLVELMIISELFKNYSVNLFCIINL